MELERLGKYELLERLGQGGMGEVWKGRDTQLRRYVAIKLLHADLQANPDFVTHFMREAQFVASLRHPNIVPVHDFQLSSTEGSKAKAYMVASRLITMPPEMRCKSLVPSQKPWVPRAPAS